MTWRGITYKVQNKQVQANLQEVAEQQENSMQTDQPAAGQFDSLIAALNSTKASLGAVLKAAPGRPCCKQHTSYTGSEWHDLTAFDQPGAGQNGNLIAALDGTSARLGTMLKAALKLL